MKKQVEKNIACRIWLDDCRTPPPGWTWAKSVSEARELIRGNKVTDISFDHDLGLSESGYDLACWIEKKAACRSLVPMKWKVHSSNPAGRANIERAMLSAERFWVNDHPEFYEIRKNSPAELYGKSGRHIRRPFPGQS